MYPRDAYIAMTKLGLRAINVLRLG
jgi:hypothetical protein